MYTVYMYMYTVYHAVHFLVVIHLLFYYLLSISITPLAVLAPGYWVCPWVPECHGRCLDGPWVWGRT